MRLSFKYTPVKIGAYLVHRPMLPPVLRKGEKHISTVGILDSGSDFILIPKDIAEYLDLELSGNEKAEAIGGKLRQKSR